MELRRVGVMVMILVGVTAMGCQSNARRTGPRAPHMMAASGDRALAKGDFATAEAEYAQVVEAQPWNARARLQYGKALLGVDNPRKAREELEKAYTTLPKDDEVMYTLAEAMGRSGEYESGVRLLQTIAEERRRPTDWLRLGRYAQRGKDYDTAEKAYLAAALGDGGLHAEYQMALYGYYMEIGDETKAVQRLAMAYWLEPKNEEFAAKIKNHGYQPGAAFALRPVEQASQRVPDPVILRGDR
ncbi:MAG: tetratricopeptide repeat protein [Phycisphaerae bacterium]|nr:tetratricopeptide repeat protein [Phycisphaerae bacterium]